MKKQCSALIELWRPQPGHILDAEIAMLAQVLHACVHDGASVSFVLPFTLRDAADFWREHVLPYVLAGSRQVLLARLADEIVGTVQLDLATPPNQPHRAEVKKLLIHPDARRQGIAKNLMIAVEEHARGANRRLLTLDTVTGGPAERLYLDVGYVRVGVIPNYALNFDSRVLESTTVMYKYV